jgi:hypothetical protein
MMQYYHVQNLFISHSLVAALQDNADSNPEINDPIDQNAPNALKLSAAEVKYA